MEDISILSGLVGMTVEFSCYSAHCLLPELEHKPLNPALHLYSCDSPIIKEIL